MAYRYRDNDPRQAVENYASWIDALHSEGLSVLSVVFQFNQLPGSQLSKIAQMQERSRPWLTWSLEEWTRFYIQIDHLI
jgi:hypothetical protein